MKINTKNLQILAIALRNVTEDKFHMGCDRSKECPHEGTLSDIGFKSPIDCGTVGSALGHAPLTAGLESHRYDYSPFRKVLMFPLYCERVFGIKLNDCNWEWLFSPYWIYDDNTPKGAAERIEHLIKHGKPPADFAGFDEGYKF